MMPMPMAFDGYVEKAARVSSTCLVTVNRGVEDVLIAVVYGLKGFPQAINAVFPQAQVQTCIVHLIRNSLEFVGWKERKLVAAELKNIYRATTEDEAQRALETFASGPWGLKYPTITAIWRRQWQEVIPFFAYPITLLPANATQPKIL